MPMLASPSSKASLAALLLLAISALSACGDNAPSPTESPRDAGDAGEDDVSYDSGSPDTDEDASALPTCGDGIVYEGEECDDGNAIDDDACSNACTLPTCGDGIVQESEACDDAGESESCNADCTPAECGDGILNASAGEECDDGNDTNDDACTNVCELPACDDGILNQDETDVDCGGSCAPCALDQRCTTDADCTSGVCGDANTCTALASCLELITRSPGLPDGEYLIDRDGQGPIAPVTVYCDMTSDGGGYTFLKLPRGSQLDAPGAEALCAEYGMQLHITRSPAHLRSTIQVAHSIHIGPSGRPQYIVMLGIYPDFQGASCANQPFNSSNPDCDWSASDGGPFWVSERTDLSEPNGSGPLSQSALYLWGSDEVFDYYDDPEGARSSHIMCQVGDKLP